MANARVYLLAVFIMILSSCSDFFSTRSPETPETNDNTASSKSVLELITNFKESLLKNNKALYESLFADSIRTGSTYVFESSASDIEEPRIFDSWSKENEMIFITELFKTRYFSSIDLIYDDIEEPIEDSVSIEFDYEMILKDSVEYYIGGPVIFDLIRKDNLWYIKKWTDEFRDRDNLSSFSKLKEPFVK